MNTDKQLNNKTAKFNSIHLQKWPEFDPKFLVQDEVVIVVQVNGKVRDTIMIHNSCLPKSGTGGQAEFIIQNSVEDKAKESEKIKAYLEGKKIIKVIYVEGKIINFVTS